MQAHLRAFAFSLAALFYLVAGTYKASHFSPDFIPVYSGARCLIHGCNPYNRPELVQQYLLAHGYPKLVGPEREVTPVYPPSTLLALSPLTLFSVKVASVVWALLGGSVLILATWLVLSLSSKDRTEVPTLLAMFILILDHGLLGMGNPVTFSCGLAVIATVLFLTDRYVALAAVLMTLSLAVKPQIAGLIILYFLVRGIRRKWAAVSLAGCAAFMFVGILILQSRPGSRGWLSAMRMTLTECAKPGHGMDPTPANPQIGLTSLQTLTSIFISSPTAWSAAALSITLGLFVVWIIAAKGWERDPPNHFYTLPPLLVLSFFPVYRRSSDALILLLSFPMIVAVLKRHKVLGIAVALVTALPVAEDAFQWNIIHFVGRFWNLTEVLSHKAAFILLMRPYSLQMLALFALYLVAIRVLSAEYCITQNTV